MIIPLVSCGKTPAGDIIDTNEITEPIVENSTIEETTNPRDIPDELPEMDFGGQELRIAVEPDKEYEICSDEITGEITNDVIYNRNILIEDRFNAKIKTIVTEITDDHIITTVTAGEDAYDMAGIKAWLASKPVATRSLINWRDIPYINLDKPWYYNETNSQATLNGKLFNLTSYLAVTTLLDTYAMFFNERICNDYGYSPIDLYNLVYEGKWTYDTFNSILSQIYVDSNGNGKNDLDDLHGYLGAECHPLDIWLTAFDQPLTSKNDDGTLNIEIYTEKTISAYEKIFDLTYNNPASFRKRDNYLEYTYFTEARAAFTPLPFHTTFAELRDMEDSYVILPLPKWDESQQKYRTHIYDQYTTYNIPKTVPAERYEFIGILTEALCAESYKTVYPAYYDVALKNKYAADADAAKMIDIIVEGAGMDFAFMYGDYMARIPFLFRESINNKADFTSAYEKIQYSLEKQLPELYSFFED